MSDPKSYAKRPTDKAVLLGQVITPASIAAQMVGRLFKDRPTEPINILDACVGPFTFPRALADAGVLGSGDRITAVDIDPDMISQRDGWPEINEAVDLECRLGNYLEIELQEKYDFAIMNPPYIRQEWLDDKHQYQDAFQQRYQIKIPGSSNLYVYFIAKVIQDLKPGGRFAIIVYDSWQSTLYGRWLMGYLSRNCRSLELEVVTDQPFGEHLIDATILYGVKISRRASKIAKHPKVTVIATEIESPLTNTPGFVQLDSIFSSRRGLRLKQVDFFLCELDQFESLGATPFLKKVVKLNGLYHVPDDHPEAALLLTSEGENQAILAVLQERLELAQEEPENNLSILTWFKDQPDRWFEHREAPKAPLVFNYYLRNRPRHIYNPSRAYADNFYGLVPLGGDPLAWLAALNSTAVSSEIMAHSRNQGNGLAKIQLYEYRKILVPNICEWDIGVQGKLSILGRQLIQEPEAARKTILEIDQLIFDVLSEPLLAPINIEEVFRQLDFQARKPREQ